MQHFLLSMRASALAALSLVAALGNGYAHAQGLRVSPNLSLGRAPSNAQQTADYIVAIVNTEPITNNEVRSRVLQLEQQALSRGGNIPPRDQLMNEVLDRIINERAQVQLAKDNGFKLEESAVDAAVQSVARQNQMTVEQLRERMKMDGIDYASYRKNLRDEITLTRVREREVDARLRISESDLDDFIREQQGSQTGLLEINIAQILISAPDSANAEQMRGLQQRAQRVLERVKSGEDFAALAREYSDGPERNQGGVMGMRSPERYPQLFVDAVAKLAAGSAIAAPIRSGAGFHILKLIEKRQSGLSNLTLSQTRARHILLRPSAQLSESAAVQRMEGLRRSIAGGQDFAAVAKEFSQDGSAREGGDLGWANPGQFVPEFEEAMNALAPGQMSEPVVSRFGVHLIQVTERRTRNLTDREQREAARGALREKKLDETYSNWAQEVRSRAYVEMRETPR